MPTTISGLCVLITNAFMERRTGSELYVRDLAVELISRGHKPVVYSPRIGDLAGELRNKSIPVIKDLESIGVKPDLIHGQHHMETMTALSRFPDTPAVFFCHGWQPWEETPPVHPRIVHYVTVSDALLDRLVYECGIPAEKISVILNSVDLNKFLPRPVLPVIPKRALVLNNIADEDNILVVREACARNNITVDIMGYASGNPSSDPETQLGAYDVVFAVGRAALEGLASGAAVICCGQEGVGGMVTTQKLQWLRRNNFGIRVLNKPLTADIISEEINRYDPKDAREVTRLVQETAGQNEMVNQILDVYTLALEKWETNPRPDPVVESLAISNYLHGMSDRLYDPH